MRLTFFLLAWISLALGIIGAFLPILPTTPFLILSAFLFSKSSPHFHQWLLSLPIAGDAITDWNQNQVIRPRAKMLCGMMMTISLIAIWVFAKVHFSVKILATALMISVGLFVLTRRGK